MVTIGIGDDSRPSVANESLFSNSEFRSQLRDLPPSAKLVAKVLDLNAPLGQAQLAEETLLPSRTVRYALTELEDTNLVSKRISLKDARKQIYTLHRPE